jgi:hypothetical protein
MTPHIQVDDDEIQRSAGVQVACDRERLSVIGRIASSLSKRILWFEPSSAPMTRT